MNIPQQSIYIIIITILRAFLGNIQITKASPRLLIILLLILPLPLLIFLLLRIQTTCSALLPRRFERSRLQGAVLLDVFAPVQREQDDEVSVVGRAVP